MRLCTFVLLFAIAQPLTTSAEVTGVTIASRTTIADGRAFGTTGSYERLVGRIEFALDPSNPHNAAIVDLNHAQRDADGRVHFSADLHVLRPTDPASPPRAAGRSRWQ